MDRKSLHSTALMKHGTVYSEKSLQLTNNVKLIQLDFICPFLKMFNKFCCQSLPKNKDGTSFMSNGST